MINILGINISTLKKAKVLKKIEQFLNNKKQYYIVTPNPEIVLEANKNEELFFILNKANLAIPDGIGLKFAALVMGKNIYRLTGADLVKSILQLRITNLPRQQAGYQLRIAVINWNGGLSKKEDIKKVLDKYKIESLVVDIEKDSSMPEKMVNFKPNILFCTFGTPYQEKFIYHNIKKIPTIKLGIGIGGAFDFLTNKTKRAPKLLRILGLEWLWRLFTHKGKTSEDRRKRLKKIKKAAIIFPWKFIKWRFVNPFLYRKNVACFLYKKENNNFKILLVEKKLELDHWQLPQGGTDGEDIVTAGERELEEEINCNKFKEINSFRNVYKYKFGVEKARANVLAKNIGGYKGQKQSLFIAEFLGQDKDIKINFWDHRDWKWADANNLVNEVHTLRKEAAKIFLEKFK